MAFKKGEKRPANAGRKKGSKNLWDRKVEDIAMKYELDPFEVLLKICCDDWKGLGYEQAHYFSETAAGAIKMNHVISPEMRLKAATEATKYLYSQKKSVELSSGETGIKIIIQDYENKDKE